LRASGGKPAPFDQQTILADGAPRTTLAEVEALSSLLERPKAQVGDLTDPTKHAGGRRWSWPTMPDTTTAPESATIPTRR
jgi:hypothetical protein